jgi:hypothetical protein
MSYRFADSLRAGSGWNWFSTSSLLILLTSCQRNCPKQVEFHSKNKFEKLVHLVGFIIRNFVWILRNDKLVKATFEHVAKVNVIYFTVQQVTLNLIFF